MGPFTFDRYKKNLDDFKQLAKAAIPKLENSKYLNPEFDNALLIITHPNTSHVAILELTVIEGKEPHLRHTNMYTYHLTHKGDVIPYMKEKGCNLSYYYASIVYQWIFKI